MFSCCQHNHEELDFSLYNKNITGECRDLCITYFPFNKMEEKKEILPKIKWDCNIKINITYSSNEYDRTMDKKQIATNLAGFKQWFFEKYQNIKRSKRLVE